MADPLPSQSGGAGPNSSNNNNHQNQQAAVPAPAVAPPAAVPVPAPVATAAPPPAYYHHPYPAAAAPPPAYPPYPQVAAPSPYHIHPYAPAPSPYGYYAPPPPQPYPYGYAVAPAPLAVAPAPPLLQPSASSAAPPAPAAAPASVVPTQPAPVAASAVALPKNNNPPALNSALPTAAAAPTKEETKAAPAKGNDDNKPAAATAKLAVSSHSLVANPTGANPTKPAMFSHALFETDESKPSQPSSTFRHALFAAAAPAAAAVSKPSNDFQARPQPTNTSNTGVELIVDIGDPDDADVAATTVVDPVTHDHNNKTQPPKRLAYVDTDPLHDRAWRRQRRRRTLDVLQRSKGSFTALLTAAYDQDDDDDDDDDWMEHDDVPAETAAHPIRNLEQLPRRIRIDLDAQLGLKKDAQPALFVKKENDDVYRQILPDGTLSAVEESVNHIQQQQRQIDATDAGLADEGWYEGTVAVGHDPQTDAQYLTPLQQWIRAQLEFFSTTDHDLGSNLRHKQKTRGKVGVRCRHCAAAQQAYPAGSIAYPNTFTSLYNLCAQKLSHLESCPNLPPAAQLQLLGIRQEETTSRSTAKSRAEGISATQYAIISARRMGLVEAAADEQQGLRFSRDVTLDPLPFETVRLQFQSEQAAAAGGGSTTTTSGMMSSDMPVLDATTSMEPHPSALVASSREPRIAADVDSEAVLADVVANSDDYPNNAALSKSDDKSMVTDYIFLLVRQMAICWLGPTDLSNRRLRREHGLAGFCCRWCRQPDGSAGPDQDSKSRSFPTTAENMKSPVSISFPNHLQKCPDVPSRIKAALLSYKKIHARQMAQLPFGSQKRLYEELFSRLRASDRIGGVDNYSNNQVPTHVPKPVSAEAPVVEEPDPGPTKEATPVGEKVESDGGDKTIDNGTAPFPQVSDNDTKTILATAVSDWDPAENDNLILPSDRPLISDYVFLTMRQLRMVHPDGPDANNRARKTSQLPGLACLHCLDQEQQVSPSGRTFPSAPDNFAAALNASLFNHMQSCRFIPKELKMALVHTRTIHSKQCSSLKFGSQRKFFNLLYQRLEAAAKKPVEEEIDIGEPDESDDEDLFADSDDEVVDDNDADRKNDDVADTEETTQLAASVAAAPNAEDTDVAVVPQMETAVATEKYLSDHGYLQVYHDDDEGDDSNVYCYCRHCVMVPVQFRVPGSIFFQPLPPLQLVRHHSSHCRSSFFDLGVVVDALDQLVQSDDYYLQMLLDRSGSFKSMIRAAVGNDDKLAQMFGEQIITIFKRRKRGDTAMYDEDLFDAHEIQFPPKNVDFASVQTAFGSFAESVLDMPISLQDHPWLLQFLQLISPLLVVPERTEAIVEEDDSEEDGEIAE